MVKRGSNGVRGGLGIGRCCNGVKDKKGKRRLKGQTDEKLNFDGSLRGGSLRLCSFVHL